MKPGVLALLTLGGLMWVLSCGDGGSPGGGDAANDVPSAPMMVTVRGQASEIGLGGRTPIAGVTVAAFEEGGTTPRAMTTTAMDGKYELVVETGGIALSGYLKGSIAGKKDNYVYPEGPIVADIPNATVLMLSQSVFDTAHTLAQVSQNPGMGWIGIQVNGSDGKPIAGATISSEPAGIVRYNNTNGFPSSGATATHADGLGYVFQVPPGNVVVSAQAPGMTFKSHAVLARADEVTTTQVSP